MNIRRQLAFSLLAVPVVVSISDSAIADTDSNYQKLSPAALQQLEAKRILSHPAKPKSDAWMELGDPWMEWQAEQAKVNLERSVVNPADILARFKQHQP